MGDFPKFQHFVPKLRKLFRAQAEEEEEEEENENKGEEKSAEASVSTVRGSDKVAASCNNEEKSITDE